MNKPILTRHPITWGELKYKNFIEPIFRVYPFMPDASLTMLHSWRGVGKTFFSLGLAQAVASGSPFLKWPTGCANVFYFDCEMGEAALQRRYKVLDSAAKFATANDGVRLFSFEHMGGVTWNLANPLAQKAMNALIDGCQFLIIDNLSAACRAEPKETFQQAFWRFRDWLLDLKSKKITVLIVHHSGKEGKQRGISDIEDPLDTVIHLRRAEDWKVEDGTKFEFHFEKTRGISPTNPRDLESLAIELKSHSETEIEWLYAPLSEVKEKNFEEKTKTTKQWNAGDDDLF